MQYRKEIDGLRALAVVPVILFHAGFQFFSGGFVGVDVFFVISGYLITSILVAEMQSGRFSLAAFYERRARRILPALALVMAVSVPFAWLWLSPAAMRDFAESMIAVAIFVSNFLFWRESGYFDSDAELKPLLHTWSLAVEEQYYLIFPLLLMLLWPAGRRTLTTSVVILAISSLVYAQWTISRDQAASFFLLPSRAWELLAGCLAALCLGNASTWPGMKSWQQSALALAGIMMILAAVFGFDNRTPFPGFYALLPVIGTVLIILFAAPDNLAGKILGLRPLVAIGLISYSAYLWHQPMLAFARLSDADEPTLAIMWLLIVATFLFAWLSWRYVEAPFRDRQRFNRQQIFIASGCMIAVFILIGGIMVAAKGFPQRLSAVEYNIYMVSQERNPRRGLCNSFDLGKPLPLDACTPKGQFEHRAVLIGDSHANALAPTLGSMLEDKGIAMTPLTRGGCVPVLGLSKSGRPDDCTVYNELVYDFIYNTPEVEIVMLAARWTLALEGTRFNNGEGGIEGGDSGAVYPLDGFTDDEPLRKSQVVASFHAQISELLAAGKKVVLLYPVPEAGWNVPNRMIRKRNTAFPEHYAATHYDVFQSRNAETLAALDGIGEHQRLLRFRPHRIFCDASLPDHCIVHIEGQPLYKDDDHVSRFGAAKLGQSLVRDIQDWLGGMPEQ